MEKQFEYVTDLETAYQHLERIDVNEIVSNCSHHGYSGTLTKVNNSAVRLIIFEGEYHWHKHDNDDEFVYVLQGQLWIDLVDRTIELNPNQGMTISVGVVHCLRARQKTVILTVETSAIKPNTD